MPLRNCLNRPVSRTRATAKCSGAKLGIVGNATGSSTHSVSPMRTSVALTRPTTSPGNASSMVSRSWPNTEWAYLVANGLPVGPWVTTMPRSNRPRADAHERDAVAVRGVHVGLHLEHERRERRVEVAGLAVHVVARRRRRREVDDGVEQQAHAEVGERRAEEHRRRDSPARNDSTSKSAPTASSSASSSCAAVQAAPSSVGGSVERRRPPRAPRRAPGRAGEAGERCRCGGRSRRGSRRGCRPAT